MSDTEIAVRYAWILEHSELVTQIVTHPEGAQVSPAQARDIVTLTDELIGAVNELTAILRST